MNIVVLSGGTATNSLTECFTNLTLSKNHQLTYILPISDNGGSTSEILRVIGGPAIGDIRSRIVRLLNDEQLSQFFSFRLTDDPIEAKIQWNMIVEGSHEIWNNISIEKKEMCRSFIIHIQSELLKKTRHSNPFKYEKASIGNLFLTGARLFMGSLDAAIELMMRIGRCDPLLKIMPCVSTNHTYHISALLKNGEVITGQSQISHPSKRNKIDSKSTTNSSSIQVTSSESSFTTTTSSRLLSNDGIFYHLSNSHEDSILSENEHLFDDAEDEIEEDEFANPTTILPELKASQLHFDKIDDGDMLPAAVKRILYINPYGEEIKPNGNVRALTRMKNADIIVYSIGSLLTSLLPIVILGNIAKCISERNSTKKVLLINNKYDRESFGLDGVRYIKLIVDSMRKALRKFDKSKNNNNKMPMNILDQEQQCRIPWNTFITDIIYLDKGEIKIDENFMAKRGIRCHSIKDAKLMTNEKLEQILNEINSSN